MQHWFYNVGFSFLIFYFIYQNDDYSFELKLYFEHGLTIEQTSSIN